MQRHRRNNRIATKQRVRGIRQPPPGRPHDILPVTVFQGQNQFARTRCIQQRRPSLTPASG